MTDPSLSLAVIPLMKGIVYRDGNEAAWQQVRAASCARSQRPAPAE